MGRRTANEDAYLQWPAQLIGFSLVNTDAAMQLVMESDLGVGYVIVSTQLYAIHAQVGMHNTGPCYVFGINLGHGYERTAIHRPIDNLRQLADAGGSVQNGCIALCFPWQGRQRCGSNARVPERLLQHPHRVRFHVYQYFDLVKRIAEHETGAFQRAEKVG